MNYPFSVILTKSDKLNKTEREERLNKIRFELGDFAEECKIIPFSALNSEGVEEIRGIIESSAI